MQNNCVKCGTLLSADDIGASKKLINRGMTENFLCIDCLAEKHGVGPERIREKIEEWRESGCLLFAKVE
ncbi:MAG: hypothetical protein E7595_07060 [Ruminococcaceae bacterium]|nr:hypothetical protein [Oscillospiraceae bacterium]